MSDAALGTQAQLDALAATVSYRLEPQGWATRFPVVLGQLLKGRLDPAQAEAALLELDAIVAETQRLPADKVVRSLQDLRRPDGEPSGVASVYEYFRADDGRPILDVLREGVRAARVSERPLVVSTPALARARRVAWLELLAGVVWIVGGATLFPRVVVITGHSGGHEGVLLWPQGLVLLVHALWTLACLREPRLDLWGRRNALALLLFSVAAYAALVWLTWRG